MRSMTARPAILLVALCSIPVAAQNRPAPARTELAPGILLFQTPSYGDVGLDGNSIAVASRDGVLVFDTNGTPAAAAAVLAEIRAITDSAGTMDRQLALALGPLVRHRDLSARLPRRPHRRARENARS